MRRVTLAVVCAVLMAVAGAALVVAILATSHADETSACVNNILGQRAVPTARDNAAHIAFAEAVDDLVLKPSATPAQLASEAAAFRLAVQTYVDTLLADERERDKHPLGRC